MLLTSLFVSRFYTLAFHPLSSFKKEKKMVYKMAQSWKRQTSLEALLSRAVVSDIGITIHVSGRVSQIEDFSLCGINIQQSDCM